MNTTLVLLIALVLGIGFALIAGSAVYSMWPQAKKITAPMLRLAVLPMAEALRKIGAPFAFSISMLYADRAACHGNTG